MLATRIIIPGLERIKLRLGLENDDFEMESKDKSSQNGKLLCSMIALRGWSVDRRGLDTRIDPAFKPKSSPGWMCRDKIHEECGWIKIIVECHQICPTTLSPSQQK